MPKTRFPRASRLTALCLASSLLFSPLAVLARCDTAYWHEAGAAGSNPQWMLTIPPTKTLSGLSLPVTHDSGTCTGNGGSDVRTQTMPIREQLNSGIRWLDFRPKYFDALAYRNCNDGHSSPSCQLWVFQGDIPKPVVFERDIPFRAPTRVAYDANETGCIGLNAANGPLQDRPRFGDSP